MSENVASAGIMVPLSRKLTREEREELEELLWKQNSNVRFNYEGTLAYTDEGGEEYGISFGEMGKYSIAEFDDLLQFDLMILADKAKPYTCYWYNGADSDMSMMKLQRFLERTGQQ